MKLSRLTAAAIAAMTAITPLSFHSSVLFTPLSVSAVDAGAVAALPDWIPNDFDSAADFRNLYGATHIENGLICVVASLRRDKVAEGEPQGMLRYEIQTTDSSVKMLQHTSFSHENSSYYFEVAVFDPQQAGDFDIAVIDTWAKDTDPDLQFGHAVSRYSFSAEDDMNITETDIFSWLPDGKDEYSRYLSEFGEVSVRDNYVVFCTMTVDQFGDHWEPDSNNKYENIQYLLSSDCTMQAPDLWDDSSVDVIYVYQAVKDGYEKLSWVLTSDYRPDQQEPTPYYLTADCAVLDNAQTVLLPGHVRVKLVDSDTNEPIIYQNDSDTEFGYILFRERDLGEGYVENPAVTGLKTNPAIIHYAYLSEEREYTFHIEQSSKVKNYSILRDESSIMRNDNNSYDLIFKLKFTPTGDVNDDGEFNFADVELLQKWLLAVPDTQLANWKAADFCNDNRLNAADLSLMKRALMQERNLPVEVSIREGGGVVGADIRYKVYCEDEKDILYYQDLTYDQEPRSMAIPITEQDYCEIMSEAYSNYLESVNTPKEWSEIDFEITLGYADGSQKQSSSDSFPSVLTKLRKIVKTYETSHSSYVEPDERFEYGIPFRVVDDGLKLYLGPDESYEAVASIPADVRLIEKGAQNGNSEWLFTEYNGQYGWINTLDSEGNMVIYFEEAAKKPVIYLYPEQETDVHVELELTESELHTTYPKYDNGWNVTAYPDGTLLNKADGSCHRYLFWDSVNCRTRFDFSKGFCVAGSDTERFLKEKLTYMGLIEQEMNEFIVYWLPLMEHNAYNLISFQGEAYTNSAKLTVTPTPDSECRIFMAYVPLESPVEIEPQQLETFERKGFTVVEWGGVEILS